MDTQKTAFLSALDTLTRDEGGLPFILGADANGIVNVKDLSSFPHFLIAGAAGTGKSTLAHSVLLSLIKTVSPDKLRLILCDTKYIEFCGYSREPHLLAPVVTDARRFLGVVNWATMETFRRLKLMGAAGVRSFELYNERMEVCDKLPHILLAFDDVSAVPDNVSIMDSLATIIQNGRAAGIHVMLVTQAPGDRRLSDIVKNLMPSRAVFNVFSDAEKRMLLGSIKKNVPLDVGEMLFFRAQSGVAQKLQCFQVTDRDIKTVVSDAIERYGASDQDCISEFCSPVIPELTVFELEVDEMLPAAVDVILETGQASVSMLQKRLKFGYARAARIVDEMEEKGIVGPFTGSKPRTILITKEQWQAQNGVETDSEDVEPESFDPEEVTPQADPVEGPENTPPVVIPCAEVIPDPQLTSEPIPNKKKWYQKVWDILSSRCSPQEAEVIKDDAFPTYQEINEGATVIATQAELSAFLKLHPLLEDFHTKVVGVTYCNDDGSSRQINLSHCRNGETVMLYSFLFHEAPEIAVISKHGQIGFLSADLAGLLNSKYGNNMLSHARISEVTGGANGLCYGCNLHVQIFKE